MEKGMNRCIHINQHTRDRRLQGGGGGGTG